MCVNGLGLVAGSCSETLAGVPLGYFSSHTVKPYHTEFLNKNGVGTSNFKRFLLENLSIAFKIRQSRSAAVE